MKIKLSDLSVNESATIDSFDETGLAAIFINDLLDYGMLPGSEVRMLHKSGSQNKILIGIGLAEISLREKDAEFIRVKTKS